MKAKINGIEVEGTPEEIAKLLADKYVTPLPISERIVRDQIKEKCENCPHNGEGCNPQFCL